MHPRSIPAPRWTIRRPVRGTSARRGSEWCRSCLLLTLIVRVKNRTHGFRRDTGRIDLRETVQKDLDLFAAMRRRYALREGRANGVAQSLRIVVDQRIRERGRR